MGKYPKRIFLPALALMMLSGAANAENVSVSTPKTSTESFCNQHLPRIPMAGLDPQKRYSITELNRIDRTPLAFEGKTFSGEYLMQNGLEIPYSHNADWGKANEWASRVLLLETAE